MKAFVCGQKFNVYCFCCLHGSMIRYWHIGYRPYVKIGHMKGLAICDGQYGHYIRLDIGLWAASILYNTGHDKEIHSSSCNPLSLLYIQL